MEENNVIEKKKGITGTTLKIIALTAMFIDHFAAILLTDYLNSVTVYFPDAAKQQEWYLTHPDVTMVSMLMMFMRLIGRFGFPLFAFLIAEGFLHTRSVKKYALNLAIFALLSELPFNLGFSSLLFYRYYQNVFFTLLLGLLCISGIHWLCKSFQENEKCRLLFYPAALLAGAFAVYMVINNTWLVTSFVQIDRGHRFIIMGAGALISFLLFLIIGAKWETEQRNRFSFFIFILTVCCLLADFLRTDYGAAGVLTITVMYLYRKKRTKAFGAGCLVLTLMSPIEAFAYFMMIPIAKYNGERGMKINKYFFYAFYPIHIGLLYLLTFLLGFTTFHLR